MSPSHLLENILRHSSFPSTISPWQWKGKKEKFVSSGFSPCWGYFLWMNGDLGAGCLSWGQRPVWNIHFTSYASISSSSWAMPASSYGQYLPQRPPALSPPLYYCDSLVSLRICVMKLFPPSGVLWGEEFLGPLGSRRVNSWKSLTYFFSHVVSIDLHDYCLLCILSNICSFPAVTMICSHGL